MKRLFDVIISFLSLLLLSPLFSLVAFIVFLQDFHFPLYIAKRVGKNMVPFNMVKMRSMVYNADSNNVDSTSADDRRITRIGNFIRKFKIDELTQLYNVLKGDMSLVGPRPNVQRDVDIYTREEKHLLSVHPGITDFSSIIFSDEGEILEGSVDPDLKYNRLIRPWKSRLGLVYIDKKTFFLDFKLILITALTLFSKQKALIYITKMLEELSVDPKIIEISKRNKTLVPFPPPGMKEPVVSR